MPDFSRVEYMIPELQLHVPSMSGLAKAQETMKKSLMVHYEEYQIWRGKGKEGAGNTVLSRG